MQGNNKYFYRERRKDDDDELVCEGVRTIKNKQEASKNQVIYIDYRQEFPVQEGICSNIDAKALALEEINKQISPFKAQILDKKERKLIEKIFNLINPILNKWEIVMPNFFRNLPPNVRRECERRHLRCWNSFCGACQPICNIYDNIKKAKGNVTYLQPLHRKYLYNNIKRAKGNVTADDDRKISNFIYQFYQIIIAYKKQWEELRRQYPEIKQDDNLIEDLSRVYNQCNNLYEQTRIEYYKLIDDEFTKQVYAKYPSYIQQPAEAYNDINMMDKINTNNLLECTFGQKNTNEQKNKDNGSNQIINNDPLEYTFRPQDSLKEKQINKNNKQLLNNKVPMKTNRYNYTERMLDKKKTEIVKKNTKKQQLQTNKPLKRKNNFAISASNQYSNTKRILNRAENNGKYEQFCRNNFGANKQLLNNRAPMKTNQYNYTGRNLNKAENNNKYKIDYQYSNTKRILNRAENNGKYKQFCRNNFR